jgi:hypothetical protein
VVIADRTDQWGITVVNIVTAGAGLSTAKSNL